MAIKYRHQLKNSDRLGGHLNLDPRRLDYGEHGWEECYLDGVLDAMQWGAPWREPCEHRAEFRRFLEGAQLDEEAIADLLDRYFYDDKDYAWYLQVARDRLISEVYLPEDLQAQLLKAGEGLDDFVALTGAAYRLGKEWFDTQNIEGEFLQVYWDRKESNDYKD